eukprot:6314144-Heterocapsa_arctica.AAC.1
MAFGEIVSTKQKSPWFSTSAPHMAVVYADLFLMDKALRDDDWRLVKTSFFSQLARSRSLALRRVDTTTWLFSLGDVSGCSFRGWPAEVRSQAGKLKSLSPDLKAKPVWETISHPEEWEAVSFSWHSPVHQLLAEPERKTQILHNLSVLAVPDSQPRLLMEQAAMHGFWEVGRQVLTWIAKYYGVEVPPSPSLLDLLQARLGINVDWDPSPLWLGESRKGPSALIHKILPKASDMQVTQYLSMRFKHFDRFADMLMCDEAGDLVHEKDRKEFEEAQCTLKRSQDEHAEFKKDWAKARSGCLTKSAQKRLSTFKNDAARAVSTKWVGGSLSKEQAAAFVPVPCRIYRDGVNGRWQCTYVSDGRRLSKSFSFAVWGHDLACRMCVQWSWQEVLVMHGISIDRCPVEGLFEQSLAAEGAPASGAASSSGAGVI